MSSSAIKWIALAVVAYVLWRLVEARRQGTPAIGGGVNVPATPPTVGGAGVAPQPPKPAQQLAPPDDSVDLAGDVADGEGIWLAGDVILNNQIDAYRQSWKPASMVRPYADCPPLYWRLMFRLLSLSLTRDDELSARYKYLILDAQQKANQALAAQIISQIVAIVPIVGHVFAAISSSMGNQISQSIAAEGSAAKFADAVRIAADPQNVDPPLQELLKRTNLPYPVDALPVAPGSLQIDDFFRNGYTFPWHGPDGRAFTFPARWFALLQIGLFVPWLSFELGTRKGTRAWVNASARVMKLADIFRAKYAPVDPGTYGYSYWYRNPVLGDVMGGFLAPSTEDVHYVDAAGVTYNFDGTILRVALPPGDDGKGSIVPTGSAATTGPGEQFGESASDAAANANVPTAPSPYVAPPPVVVKTIGGTYVRTGGKGGEISVD